MQKTRKFFISLLGIAIFGFILLQNSSFSFAQQTIIGSFSGWAWGGINQQNGQVGGVGWISFKDSKNPPMYQVDLNSNNYLTGYAWANPMDPVSGTQSFGWVKFGGLSGFPTGSGTVSDNAKLSGSNIVGWARFCSATLNPLGTNIPGNCNSMNIHPNSGNWDGWISFSGNAISSSGTQNGSYAVSLGTSNSQGQQPLTGWAWGGPLNVGWINLSGVFLTQNPNSGKSVMNFSISTQGGTTITANKQNPTVSALVSSSSNFSLSWYLLDVVANSCVASIDWLGNQVSTNGNHLGPQYSFPNTTNNPITKSYVLTCQGNEDVPGGPNIPIVRTINVTIAPASANVASVSVVPNYFAVMPMGKVDISWLGVGVVPGSCVGSATFYHAGTNSTNTVSIPGWSQTNPPSNFFPGSQGIRTKIEVAGFATGDYTTYNLMCTRASGFTSNSPSSVCPPSAPQGRVCGKGIVGILEGASLSLTAYKNPYNPLTPSLNTIVTQVAQNEKVALVWRSPLNKQLKCGPSPLGASSTPSGLWSGAKSDLLVSPFEQFENNVSVSQSLPTTYEITCQDINTSSVYTAQANVTVEGINPLVVQLVAEDEASGFGQDGLPGTVTQGGTVKIRIQKLSGDFEPGKCFVNASYPGTSWNGSGLGFDPNPPKTFLGITTGGAPIGTVINYNITCQDKLDPNMFASATDDITIINSGVNPNIDISLVSTSCIEESQPFASITVQNVNPSISFEGCELEYRYNGLQENHNFWRTAFFNSILSVFNSSGSFPFNGIPVRTSGSVSSGDLTSFRIRCTDNDTSTTTSWKTISFTIRGDGQCQNPPGGGSGNIKPIIEER